MRRPAGACTSTAPLPHGPHLSSPQSRCDSQLPLQRSTTTRGVSGSPTAGDDLLRSPRLRPLRFFSADQLLLLLRRLRSTMAEAGICQPLPPLLLLSARSRSAVGGEPGRGDAGAAGAAGVSKRESVPLKASLRDSTVPLQAGATGVGEQRLLMVQLRFNRGRSSLLVLPLHSASILCSAGRYYSTAKMATQAYQQSRAPASAAHNLAARPCLPLPPAPPTTNLRASSSLPKRTSAVSPLRASMNSAVPVSSPRGAEVYSRPARRVGGARPAKLWCGQRQLPGMEGAAP